MTSDTVVQHVLWWLAPTLELAVAIAMWRSSQSKRFPLFFLFIVSHLCQFVIAFCAYKYSYKAYFYVYWGWIPFDTLTTLLVIEELFKAVVSPYRAVRGLGVSTFRGAAVALCGLAIYTAYAAPGNDSFRIIAGLMVIDRSASFVETGLLIVLFIFCGVLGVAWRSYPFGIATGMGVFVAISTANTCARAHFGQAGDVWYALIQAFSFNLGMSVWLYYFASERSTIFRQVEGGSAQLAAWNVALQRIFRGNSPDIDC